MYNYTLKYKLKIKAIQFDGSLNSYKKICTRIPKLKYGNFENGVITLINYWEKKFSVKKGYWIIGINQGPVKYDIIIGNHHFIFLGRIKNFAIYVINNKVFKENFKKE